MTSYQKLKEENRKLKEDIYKLIDNDIEVQAQYQFKKSLQNLCMFGKASNTGTAFDGIIPIIKVKDFKTK